MARRNPMHILPVTNTSASFAQDRNHSTRTLGGDPMKKSLYLLVALAMIATMLLAGCAAPAAQPAPQPAAPTEAPATVGSVTAMPSQHRASR